MRKDESNEGGSAKSPSDEGGRTRRRRPRDRWKAHGKQGVVGGGRIPQRRILEKAPKEHAPREGVWNAHGGRGQCAGAGGSPKPTLVLRSRARGLDEELPGSRVWMWRLVTKRESVTYGNPRNMSGHLRKPDKPNTQPPGLRPVYESLLIPRD